MLSKRNRDLDLEYQGKVRAINDKGKQPAPMPIEERKPVPAEPQRPQKKRKHHQAKSDQAPAKPYDLQQMISEELQRQHSATPSEKET